MGLRMEPPPADFKPVAGRGHPGLLSLSSRAWLAYSYLPGHCTPVWEALMRAAQPPHPPPTREAQILGSCPTSPAGHRGLQPVRCRLLPTIPATSTVMYVCSLVCSPRISK